MLSDSEEAREVVLETFAAAWDRVDRLGDEHDALLPWLLRIARNRAIDRLRRRRRFRLKLARAEALASCRRTACTRSRSTRRPSRGGTCTSRCMRRSRPCRRSSGRRCGWPISSGLTHSEIARQLAIPMGTVKTRLRLAFDKLRTSLAPIKDWIA